MRSYVSAIDGGCMAGGFWDLRDESDTELLLNAVRRWLSWPKQGLDDPTGPSVGWFVPLWFAAAGSAYVLGQVANALVGLVVRSMGLSGLPALFVALLSPTFIMLTALAIILGLWRFHPRGRWTDTLATLIAVSFASCGINIDELGAKLPPDAAAQLLVLEQVVGWGATVILVVCAWYAWKHRAKVREWMQAPQ